MNSTEYQLQVIKRKRIYPEIGDIFKINPKEDIYLYGIVVNNHINNINGDDLILVFIFKQGVDLQDAISKGVKYSDLLISPAIVGKEYWTRGYFYNVTKDNDVKRINNYGFYYIGKDKFVDEYGKEISVVPELLGTFGVFTVYGIAMEINQELIISGVI